MTNYNNAACKLCGSRCQGRFCKSCGRDEHRDQRLSPHERVVKTDKIIYDCTGCGGRYRSDSPGDCPHCGHYGARYAGDDAAGPELMTDGGITIDDYVDIGVIHDRKIAQETNPTCGAKHCDQDATHRAHANGRNKIAGEGYRCPRHVKMSRAIGNEVVEL